MRTGGRFLALIALLAVVPAAAQGPGGGVADTPSVGMGTAAVERLVTGIGEPAAREFSAEVLARNAGVAAAAERARAATERAPQVKALPDPVASLTAFLATPETRTGPQRLAMGVSQGLPWLGKRALREEAALLAARALESDVEAKRLMLVTEARRLLYELAFLDRHEKITREFLAHLLQHEEIARARYSTGVGLGQAVVKLQAEITRVENRLLDIETRRVALIAGLNALRDRPAADPVPRLPLPAAAETRLDPDSLVATALGQRPELAAADARIASADAMIRLAEKGYRPDFTVGLTYTFVDRRDDAPGRLQPPPGNGDDILGVQGGIVLPIRRARLAAATEEAMALEAASREAKRQLVAEIRAAVGDLTQKVPLGWRQLRLVEDLLVVQAEEALESAQAAYVSGTLNALDLLDAEHVLFEAHTAVARATTDYLVGIAKLEGALGGPLPSTTTTE